MDWIELLPIFRDLGIAMMALIILLTYVVGQMRRDKNDSDSDKGLMASVVGLAQTVQKLAESLPVFVEAVRLLQNTMQQQEVLNQKRFEASDTKMSEVGQRRDTQFSVIETKLDTIPAEIEAGMEPKLKEVVDTVTVLLDKFQEKLLKQIADLPVVVSTVIESAVADLPKAMIEKLEAAIEKTKADILAEIRADMSGSAIPETKPESSEPITPIIDNVPAVEPVSEVKSDGSTL